MRVNIPRAVAAIATWMTSACTMLAAPDILPSAQESTAGSSSNSQPSQVVPSDSTPATVTRDPNIAAIEGTVRHVRTGKGLNGAKVSIGDISVFMYDLTGLRPQSITILFGPEADALRGIPYGGEIILIESNRDR